MWHVYILECSDRSLYTGVTTNTKRRLKEHNSKKGGAYTRSRLSVKLVYSELYPTKSQALKREYEIKGWSRIRKKQLITP